MQGRNMLAWVTAVDKERGTWGTQLVLQMNDAWMNAQNLLLSQSWYLGFLVWKLYGLISNLENPSGRNRDLLLTYTFIPFQNVAKGTLAAVGAIRIDALPMFTDIRFFALVHILCKGEKK